MQIASSAHPEPVVAWQAVLDWIKESVVTPEGTPPSDAVALVLAIGAYIGCRFSAIHPTLALAIAEYGNAQEGLPYESIRAGFNRDYGDWLATNVQTFLHENGFDLPVKLVFLSDEEGEAEKKAGGITDDDQKNILSGLDDLFKGDKGVA